MTARKPGEDLKIVRAAFPRPNTEENDEEWQRAGGASQLDTVSLGAAAPDEERTPRPQGEFKDTKPAAFPRPNTDENDAGWQRAGGEGE
jgi:hypothetical protein